MTNAILGLSSRFLAFRAELMLSKMISKESVTAKPTTAACGRPSTETDAWTAYVCDLRNRRSSVRLTNHPRQDHTARTCWSWRASQHGEIAGGLQELHLNAEKQWDSHLFYLILKSLNVVDVAIFVFQDAFKDFSCGEVCRLSSNDYRRVIGLDRALLGRVVVL